MPKTTKKATEYKARRAKRSNTAGSPKVDMSLMMEVEEWARRHNLSFGEAIEKALKDLVKKDQEEDAFLKALEGIPEDDEPVTDEDRRCMEQALKEHAAGETIPIEKVMREYGIQS